MGGGHASSSIWQGHRVCLRAVEPDDWPLFHAMNQDDQVARAAERIPFPQSREAVRRWTEQAATQEPTNDRFRWVIVDAADEPVGTINTHTCDRQSGTFSYGVALLPNAQGHGYAPEAIRLVLRFFFTELAYQKVTVHVYEFNAGSRTLHEDLGFVPEGRLRRMVYTAGRHWDTLVYGLTKEEFAAHHAAELPPFLPPTT